MDLFVAILIVIFIGQTRFHRLLLIVLQLNLEVGKTGKNLKVT